MTEPTIDQLLHFVFMGFLGAFLYVLVWSKSAKDLASYESLRTLVVGSIVGYLYGLLHFNYGFPDLVMTSVAGYFGVDFVEAIMERFRKMIGI